MTSPALFVLSIALVCSICGTNTQHPADDLKNNMKFRREAEINNKWTNQFNQKYINNIENFIGNKRKSIENYNKNDIQVINFIEKTNNNIQTFSSNINKITNLAENPANIKVTNLADKTSSNIVNIDENDIEITNYNKYKMNSKKTNKVMNYFDNNNFRDERTKREVGDPCKSFNYEDGVKQITHPFLDNPSKYSKNVTCVTVISASNENEVIQLTFVDMFHIEDHANCEYDYLEVRDGLYGYANRIGKVCGQAFPSQMITTGPYAWVKFHSDDTIEYEGFKINIDFIPEPGNSHKIPDACLNMKFKGYSGVIDSEQIDPACISGSQNQALDVLWTIETPAKTKIFLNFTKYVLQKPNECEDNVIQVFGAVMEMDVKLKQYCGSIANYVMTSDSEAGNIMHVRYYASKAARKGSEFNATFNAFRSLSVDPTANDHCDPVTEFDCEDSTCIHHKLRCDDIAHCRLKTDEEPCDDKNVAKSTIYELHITVILVIFSLILSGMTFVFIFKCIRKLVKDHKIIQKHLKQSCEDRLDSSRLTLDPKRLQMDSEPRASLERENHTNEMYKEQRSSSRHKQSSIESDYIQETHLDLDEESWRREVDSMPVEAADILIERNGRARRSDFSKKEESIRSRTKASVDSREKERKEIRDVSVGAPDTKESGCQTRESLFQTDPPQSSDGSGTNSRGFSTFGYSGATIARPSPPAETNTSEITIELFKPQETKTHKKVDRRPISTETTRSAPDVIIVSKPIR